VPESESGVASDHTGHRPLAIVADDEADVAHHTSEHRDNLGGLNAPDGVNGAVRGGDFGRSGHGNPFTQVKESAYEKR
jgi:hypothetical protein